MFERRLRFVLIFFGMGAAAILMRLGQLQIAQGDYYRQRALDALELPPTRLPFVRGSILDREGQVLVSDEPAWDLTIDFALLAIEYSPSETAWNRETKRWRKALLERGVHTGTWSTEGMKAHQARMWSDLSEFAVRCGRSRYFIQDRAYELFVDIQNLRQRVAENRGFDAPVAEELTAHALITELSADEQIAARELLHPYPWIHVEPSSYRRYAPDVEPFAHILGRTGPVDAEAVKDDPRAEDPLGRYLPGERMGTSGVEWAAEQILRGRRGQVAHDREGNLVQEITAESGASVRLTLLGSLQRRLYQLLGETVRHHPDSNGGAIVVLDVPRREVLALVSYPSYEPNLFNDEYPRLRDDTERLPLLFRAVATRYQPGSTIKPLVCLAGLFNSIITTDTLEECRGALFPDHPDRWRCWEIHGTQTRMAHGMINAEQALTGSCNVFLYRLGENLGIDRLCGAFDMVGIGRPSGIGFREDQPGINPTSEWLMRVKNLPPTAGSARQFAIGQAELSMTPIQVANLMATYASGRYRPATLIRDAPPRPEWILPGTPEQWGAIRRGIYGVVNDPEGTAYKFAHFEHVRYALCGKTGSATAAPWPVAYRIPYVDEYHEARVAVVREGAKGPALDRFRTLHPLATFDPEDVEVAERWPPHPPAEGGNHAHAWFGGYLQEIDSAGNPDWSKSPDVAFAALVEFGGSGGRTSGPLGREIASVLLEILGPDLDGHRRQSP